MWHPFCTSLGVKTKGGAEKMLVRNCMTPDPVTIEPEENVRDAFYLLRKHGFRQFPVVRDGRLIGIVTDRDLRLALFRPELKVADVMTQRSITVSEDTTLEKAARIIRDKKFNALPVISRDGRLVGILTVTDILDGFLNLLGLSKEPLRVKVLLHDKEADVLEVIKVFQMRSERVLSFVSGKEAGVFYLWVVNCDFDKLNRKLKERGLGVNVSKGGECG